MEIVFEPFNEPVSNAMAMQLNKLL